MSGRVRECVVCRRSMSPRKEWLWHCRHCGFLASDFAAGVGASVEGVEAVRRLNFERILDGIERFVRLRGARLLEPGSSAGLFLEAAQRRGAIATGLEPEARAAAATRARGLDVVQASFPDGLEGRRPYDLIVFNAVFEHLADVGGAAEACERHLEPGGLLVINVPVSTGFLYRLANLLDRLGLPAPLARMWQMGLSSPHLSYFNPHNLAMLVTSRTRLRPVASEALLTMTAAGLKQRIGSTFSEPAASVLHLLLRVLVPLQRLLPRDIAVLYFRKPLADPSGRQEPERGG